MYAGWSRRSVCKGLEQARQSGILMCMVCFEGL